jgi:hypothetical protein
MTSRRQTEVKSKGMPTNPKPHRRELGMDELLTFEIKWKGDGIL